MNLMATTPAHWLVTLNDGAVVDVWASSVEGLSGPEDQRDYLFCNLMDIDPEDKEDFDVTGIFSADPNRMIVTVARFPRSSVARVVTA
jgi:hypothetical protein